MGKRNLHISHPPPRPPPQQKIQQWLHEANLCLYINFSCFLFVCFYFLLESSGSQNLVSNNQFHLIIGSVNL